MFWLVVARAVQGVGGGGVLQLVQIVISDIVSLEDRGKYTGFIGAAWSIAGVFGPLLGGVRGLVRPYHPPLNLLQIFSDHISWRWCFFVNLYVLSSISPHEPADNPSGQPVELPVSFCSSSSSSTLTKGRVSENMSVNSTSSDLAS